MRARKAEASSSRPLASSPSAPSTASGSLYRPRVKLCCFDLPVAVAEALESRKMTTSSTEKMASARASCPARCVLNSGVCAFKTMLAGTATETVHVRPAPSTARADGFSG